MRGVRAKGAVVKQRRRLRGLTQEALAEMANCDVKTVYRAETNSVLDITTLVRLADALDVPFANIICDQASTDDDSANVDTIWSYFEAFNARDPYAMTAFYDEDAVLVLSTGQLSPSEDVFQGRGNLLCKWQSALSEVETEPYTRENIRLDAVNGFVFARGVGIRLRGIATGRTVRASFMCEFRLRDARILHQTIVYDTFAWESLFDLPSQARRDEG